LIVRIELAVQRVGAKRVALDSLGAIFNQFSNVSIIRNELFRLTVALKQMGVTALMTAERDEEYGRIARHGVEEFVTDNVIVLRNVLEAEKRRRTIEVLKFRGTTHQKGEYPFTVMPDQGIVVIPLSAIKHWSAWMSCFRMRDGLLGHWRWDRRSQSASGDQIRSGVGQF
jgi:circadian clock protein KaiC